MMEFAEYIDYQKYENWLSLAIGLSVTTEGLADYCENKLQYIQNDIIRKCTNNDSYDRCEFNCTKKKGKGDWCNTCKIWREELKKYFEDSKIREFETKQWRYINSINFHVDIGEIFKVFVHKIPNGIQNLQTDFQSLLSFFENCKECYINDDVIRQARCTRNDLAHKHSLQATAWDKQTSLTNLSSLLMSSGIEGTASARKARPLVTKLENTKNISKELVYYFSERTIERTRTFVQSQLQAMNQVSREKLTAKVLDDLSDMAEQNYKCRQLLTTVFLCSFLASFLIANIVLSGIQKATLDFQPKPYIQDSDCIDMGDELLHDQVQQIYSEIRLEREWLATDIFKNVSKSQHGTLITGSIGTGKSALVAQIVCARPESNFFPIRQNVLAYHICQFNNKITQNSTRFILNIARRLVYMYPDIYKHLSQNEYEGLFEDEKCSQDVFKCFDALVISPLQHYKHHLGHRQLYIVVDALDECGFYYDGTSILSLISQNLDGLPPQVKFLLTSRRTEKLVQKYEYLNRIPLETYMEQINSDMRYFIKLNGEGGKTVVYREEDVMKVIEHLNGNFLPPIHFFDSCHKLGSCKMNGHISSAVVYEQKLKILFGENGEDFYIVKNIFDVLFASYRPMPTGELLKITNWNFTSEQVFNILVKGIFSDFLKENSGIISFKHKSFQAYLTESEMSFKLDGKNGHRLFAEHFLFQLKYSTSKVDLVEFAYHVAMSGENTLNNQFLKFSDVIDQSEKSKTIFKAAREINSRNTMSLLIKFHGQYKPGIRNEKNQTPALIASIYGNHQTLEGLTHYVARSFLGPVLAVAKFRASNLVKDRSVK